MENIESSKISSKGQTTVPQEVREFLSLDTGDLLGYVIKDSQVVLKKLEPLDIQYLNSLEKTLENEWNSKEDNEAYKNL